MSDHPSGSRVPLDRLPVPPPPASVLPLSSTNSNVKSGATSASNLSVASGRISQVVARRPSPPRRTGEEMTFQQKLDEIKQMRSRVNQNGGNKMTTAFLNQVCILRLKCMRTKLACVSSIGPIFSDLK